jgi:tetratricopeptide (TPR) repeat protein
MNIERTQAWKAAEWDYGAIQADLQMAIFGPRPTPEQVAARLRRIVRRCPRFYPAVIELALRQLAAKGDVRSERMLEKGFRLMIELASPKNFDVIIDGLVENLENLWRFDLSKRLLELLADHGRLNATLHDSLSYAAARLGDLAAAQRHIEDALRLEPQNKSFWSNKGLYHLMGGELKEAGIALRKASELGPKDPVLMGNLEICKYLEKHGGDYFAYLLRPLDQKRIDQCADQERWDRVDATCADFNDCRMEAFAQSMFLKAGNARSHLPNLLATLKTFFRFVAQVDAGGTFMHEDMSMVHENFKPIMHKFIFKFADVDREMMDEIFEGLEAYYGFLASRKLVAETDFKRFCEMVRAMKGDLIGKMDRYNAIRHDETMDEDRKEELREELFEGDQAWPHL